MGSPISNLPALTLAETVLQNTVQGIEQLEAKFPNLTKELQQVLKVLSAGFSQIIQLKYGISSQLEVNNLSQAQVDAIESSINTITSQITTLTATVNSLTQQLSTDQASLASDQSLLSSLNAQLTTEQATVTTDMNTVSTDVSAVNASINGTFFANDSGVTAALSALSSPPTTAQLQALQAAIDAVPLPSGGSLIEATVERAAADAAIQTAETDVTTLSNDQAAVANTSSQISMTQATINALTATVSSETSALQADNTQLSGLQSQLASLQSQLQVAQNVVNQAVALFDKMTPTERKLFEEFYPTVTFP